MLPRLPCPLSPPNLRPGCSQQPDHLPAALTPSLHQAYQQPFYITNIILKIHPG